MLSQASAPLACAGTSACDLSPGTFLCGELHDDKLGGMLREKDIWWSPSLLSQHYDVDRIAASMIQAFFQESCGLEFGDLCDGCGVFGCDGSCEGGEGSGDEESGGDDV